MVPAYIPRMAGPRSILILSQHAPPSPLVGGRRAAALAKELSRRGHRVTVLTSLASGSGPLPHAHSTVRSRDLLVTSLNWRRDSFEAMQGTREGSYSEASRLQAWVAPDLSLATWIPFALPRALLLARGQTFDCVITTGPPQSTHLIGRALRARGVAWIADLRDGWTFDPPQEAWANAALARADALMERRLLSAADCVVGVTAPIVEDLRGRLGLKAELITNGFDPDDEVGDADGLLRADRFSLVHTGRLIAVGEAPRTLIEATLELRRRRPEDPRPVELVLAGPTSAADDELLGEPGYGDAVRAVGNLSRPDALALQRDADALVVMASGTASRPARSIATGKLFEYLASARPVLVVGERSAAAGIATGVGAGIAAANHPGRIADALERLVDGVLKPSANAVARYSWPVLADRYEELIEAVCRERPRTGSEQPTARRATRFR